jgi:hypothetical protein
MLRNSMKEGVGSLVIIIQFGREQAGEADP